MAFWRRPSAITPVLVTDRAADDDLLRAARDAVVTTGDWRPAGDLLREPSSHDLRALRVDVLARSAAEDPTWADRWLAERPTDPSALLVRGSAEVHRAWAARGDGYADSVPADAGQRFHAILRDAHRWCARAVEVAPRDPTPWLPLLWLAIGQEEPESVFRYRWGQLMALDERNRLGHVAALQYWCAKWHGSHEQMFAFARGAAAAAPGTWAVVLPLQAQVEYFLEESRTGLRGGLGAYLEWVRSDRVRRELDVAVAWARSGPRHPMALHDLSVVGYALVQADRYAEAGELFARTGQRAFEYPWYHAAEDAEVLFVKEARKAERALARA